MKRVRVATWNGKPAVVFYDLYGKRKIRKFQKQEDAEAFAVEKRKQLGTGTSTDDQMTVSEYVETFMAQQRSRASNGMISKAHVHNCHYILEKIIVPREGTRKIAHLNRPVLKRLFQSLLDEGFANTTVNTALAITSTMLSEAVEDEIVQINPCLRLAKKLGLSAWTKKPKAMTQEEAGKFLKYVSDKHPRFLLAATFYLKTGMRLGEGLALRREDFDFDRLKVYVGESASAFGEMKDPKTDLSEREVEIPPSLAESVRAELNSRVSPWLLAPEFSDPPQPKEIKRARDRFIRLMQDIRVEAKLPPFVTIHCLRHTFATLHLDRHPDHLFWVSRQLGHASVKITADLYGKGSKPTNREAVDEFDAMIQKAQRDAKYSVRRVTAGV